jgi:hypothetical protein
VIVNDFVAVAPALSVTFSVAVNVPAVVYVCEVVAPEPVPPSPNVHA